MKKNKLKTVDLSFIAMFAAIIAVCAWISIPAAVPFTLQTFGVFLAVSLLGGKRGTLAVLTYLFMGTVGMPVFSGFGSGPGYLFGATGGYILGFLFCALTMWGMECLFGKKNWVIAASMVLGIMTCYLFGTVWYIISYAGSRGAVGIGTVLAWCVVPYIVPDAVKMLLVLMIRKRLGGLLC